MLKLISVIYSTGCRGWRHIWRGSRKIWRRGGESIFSL